MSQERRSKRDGARTVDRRDSRGGTWHVGRRYRLSIQWKALLHFCRFTFCHLTSPVQKRVAELSQDSQPPPCRLGTAGCLERLLDRVEAACAPFSELAWSSDD